MNKKNVKDLVNIPEKFHIVFTTDWNAGIHSTMKMEDRRIVHEIYLDYLKWAIQDTSKKSIPTKEEEIIGFVKD